MKTAIAVALASCSFVASCASHDRPNTPESAPRSTPARVAKFPQDWEGTWAGPAELIYPDGRRRQFQMGLDVRPLAEGMWSWTITYGEGQATQQRPYELHTIDAATGRYAIDERNGIILPATFVAGILVSSFEVQGSRIIGRDEMTFTPTGDPELVTELTTFSAKSAEKTGGDAAPTVTTESVVVVQRAILRRTPGEPAPAPAPPQ